MLLSFAFGAMDMRRRNQQQASEKTVPDVCASGITREKELISVESYRLYDFNAVPEYLRDNEFILSYYRANFTVAQALSSLFRIHNESFNIWTHLLGFLLFLGFTVVASMELLPLSSSVAKCFKGRQQNNLTSEYCTLLSMKDSMARMVAPVLISQTTRWPLMVFLVGSMFCLLSSSICHLFLCHSEPLAIFLMRIDYAGIATMIVTSFFPPIYYVFQCSPIWQCVYLSIITAMGVMTVVALFAPACQSAKYRPVRASLFLSMGMIGLAPALHGLLANWSEPYSGAIMAYEAAMVLFYALGTAIYVIRIPERWKPGIFDLAGHSHGIFHILVIAGALAHYKAAILFLEWRDNHGCMHSA